MLESKGLCFVCPCLQFDEATVTEARQKTKQTSLGIMDYVYDPSTGEGSGVRNIKVQGQLGLLGKAEVILDYVLRSFLKRTEREGEGEGEREGEKGRGRGRGRGEGGEGEGEGERDQDRERQRETERQRDRETERQRDRETERQRERAKCRCLAVLRAATSLRDWPLFKAHLVVFLVNQPLIHTTAFCGLVQRA
jgi:hypothetical protein